MVNISKLRDAIDESEHTITSLSRAIGIDESTFYRKLSKEGATFTLAQADAMKRELKLSVSLAQEIFFDE